MSKSGKSGGALRRSPIHLLHRGLQLALDLYVQEAGRDAITQRQYAVLSATAAEEGLSQTQLVRITGIDRSTVAELVARMTKLGLLVRQRAAGDARTNVVRLTERGRSLLEEVEPRVAAADKRLLKLLPGKKRDDFVRMLQDLLRGDGAADLDGETPAKPAKTKDAKPAKAEKAAKKAAKIKAPVAASAPDGVTT